MCIRDRCYCDEYSLTLCVYGVEAERRRRTTVALPFGIPNLQIYIVSCFLWRHFKTGLKNSNVENFKIPYLPQMGADSPRVKTIFLRAHRAITLDGQIGGVGPVRGRSPNCPKPQISRFSHFRLTSDETIFDFSGHVRALIVICQL